MKRLVYILVLFAGVTASVNALSQKPWMKETHWQELNLTQQQKENLARIKHEFRNGLHEVRKSDREKAEKRRQVVALKQTMRASMNDILTEEQRQQLKMAMLPELEKKSSKMLKRLSHRLDLTDNQKETLKTEFNRHMSWLKSNEEASYDDVRKIAGSMNQTVENILTSEQLEEWKKVRKRFGRF